jgi:hypothetical protein
MEARVRVLWVLSKHADLKSDTNKLETLGGYVVLLVTKGIFE